MHFLAIFNSGSIVTVRLELPHMTSMAQVQNRNCVFHGRTVVHYSMNLWKLWLPDLWKLNGLLVEMTL